MYFVIGILSVWIFIKTLSYAIFELKKNSNKIGCITLIAISIISLIWPTIMVYIRGC